MKDSNRNSNVPLGLINAKEEHHVLKSHNQDSGRIVVASCRVEKKESLKSKLALNSGHV